MTSVEPERIATHEPVRAARRLLVVRVVPVLDFGGVETALAVQAEKMDRSVFELRVCTFWKAGRTAETIRRSGIPVDVLDENPAIRNPRAALALFRYLRALRPDVVHSSVPEADFHTALVSQAAGVPCTVTDEAGMPNRAFAKRLVFGLLHRNVSAIVAASSALGDYLVQDEWAPAARVSVIHNCGSSAFFEARKAAYDALSRPFRLATVGRMVPVKNQRVLVDAMGLLRRRGVDAELVIYGDGPERSALELLAQSLGVADRVTIAGFVPDLRAALLEADGYALASHSEGCSLSLVEAMAVGLPCVASRVPGNLEVMGAVSGALLPAPTDADAWADVIARLAAMPERDRRAYAERCRERAHTAFSPTAYVERLQSLYRDAFDASAGRRAHDSRRQYRS